MSGIIGFIFAFTVIFSLYSVFVGSGMAFFATGLLFLIGIPITMAVWNSDMPNPVKIFVPIGLIIGTPFLCLFLFLILI